MVVCCLAILLAIIIGVWHLKIKKERHVLHLLMLAGLLLSLAFPVRTSKTKTQEWIILLDVSDSMVVLHANSHRRLMNFYQRAITKILRSSKAKHRIGVVFFAEGAQIALPLQKTQDKIALPISRISGIRSRLDQGIHQALAMFTGNYPTKVIIFCDGNISPAVREESQRLANKNRLRVAIASMKADVVHTFADACLRELVIPRSTTSPSRIYGYALVHCSPGNFRVQISSNGRIYQEHKFRLKQTGTHRIYFSIPTVQERWQKIQARIISLSFTDSCPQNDVYWQRVRVENKSNVLWISSNSDFIGDKYADIVIPPQELASVIDHLEDFHAIVIAQGSAQVLERFSYALKDYVFNGGGLWVLGDLSTLGPGGYAGTPLEEILPVWCSPQQHEQISLLVALDVSGSMAEISEGNSKIAYAKLAFANIAKSMPADSLFSLLTFRDHAKILIPFIPAHNIKSRLADVVEHIRGHGPTNLQNALQISLKHFQQLASNRKHLMVISDGLVNASSALLKLVSQLRKAEITLSVIATGKNGHDVLQQIAKLGNGYYYRAAPKDILPLLRNDLRQLHAPLIDNRIQRITGEKRSFSRKKLTTFYGQQINKLIRTQVKSWGQALLATTKKNPLLVVGHYGLGRSVVLATNFREQWGGDLAGIEGEQLVITVLPWLYSTQNAKLELTATMRQDCLDVTVHFPIGQNHERTLQVTGDWLSHKQIMNNTGIGKYHSYLSVPPPGEYKIFLQEKIENNWTLLYKSHMVVPYSIEYQNLAMRFLDFPNNDGRKPSAVSKKKLFIGYFFLIAVLLLFVLERIWLYYFRRSIHVNS